MSETGRSATAIALKALSHLFETTLFAYVGLEIFFNRPTQNPTALGSSDAEAAAAAAALAATGAPGVVGGWHAVCSVVVATGRSSSETCEAAGTVTRCARRVRCGVSAQVMRAECCRRREGVRKDQTTHLYVAPIVSRDMWQNQRAHGD